MKLPTSMIKTIQSLFVTSELHPLIKTGGLGDVAGSLPKALALLHPNTALPELQQRILLPGYRSVLSQLPNCPVVAEITLSGQQQPTLIRQALLPDSEIILWLVDAADYFDRDGGPYADPTGEDWADNAQRFALFNRIAVEIALGHTSLNWRADIVHCHDWQTGLVPALLSHYPHRPATIFTIHNLAYQGVFPKQTFADLHLPADLWHMHGLEYHDNLAFIKGGLAYADVLTTVSPTYAEEIQHNEFGFGLDGILSARKNVLRGIINGADYSHWDPANDPYIAQQYDANSFANKQTNKIALQKEFKLPLGKRTPILAFIGRMVWQKGIDVLLAALPTLLQSNIQCVILGTGEVEQERALRQLAKAYPNKLAVYIGYDESLAHRIEAGADMFCMLSRYEPCGLNQIYSLRYGTVPIVRQTGGLADTVTDASQGARGTGYIFAKTDREDFLKAVQRAQSRYADPQKWQALAKRGMRKNFGWAESARQYLTLYIECVSQSR